MLKKTIINAAGNETQVAYDTEDQMNRDSSLISIPPGRLSCNRIFFIKWEPTRNLLVLQKSLIDFISIAIQNAIAYNLTSIALPIIGCGKYGYSPEFIAKMMVTEVKTQLTVSNIPLIVKFVVQPERQEVYEKFCQQVLTTQKSRSQALLSLTRAVPVKEIDRFESINPILDMLFTRSLIYL